MGRPCFSVIIQFCLKECAPILFIFLDKYSSQLADLLLRGVLPLPPQLLHPSLLRRIVILKRRHALRVQTSPKRFLPADARLAVSLVALHNLLDVVPQLAVLQPLRQSSYNVAVVVVLARKLPIGDRGLFDLESWALGQGKAYLALAVPLAVSELLLGDGSGHRMDISHHCIGAHMVSVVIVFGGCFY